MTISTSRPPEEVGSAFTDMLRLYQDISVWNQGRSFGFSNNIMTVTQQLLVNYYNECKAYLDDETEGKTLLPFITQDGLEQWDMHKGFFQTYNVNVF